MEKAQPIVHLWDMDGNNICGRTDANAQTANVVNVTCRDCNRKFNRMREQAREKAHQAVSHAPDCAGCTEAGGTHVLAVAG